MKQFCPKCCEWFDIDERFCPICDVGLYFKKEHKTTTNNGKKLKVISRPKFNRLRTTGITQLVLGLIIVVSAIITEKILFGLSGILLLILGTLSINTYNYFKRTAPLPEYNPAPNTTQEPIVLYAKPTIICPYCKSDNTVKIDTISRMGSIFIAGAASGKIGKQWHCNNCKSDF